MAPIISITPQTQTPLLLVSGRAYAKRINLISRPLVGRGGALHPFQPSNHPIFPFPRVPSIVPPFPKMAFLSNCSFPLRRSQLCTTRGEVYLPGPDCGQNRLDALTAGTHTHTQNKTNKNDVSVSAEPKSANKHVNCRVWRKPCPTTASQTAPQVGPRTSQEQRRACKWGLPKSAPLILVFPHLPKNVCHCAI